MEEGQSKKGSYDKINMPELKILRKEELEDKICVIVGTRPGIIKMSPIIRELRKRGINYFVVHTGQHYSYEMDRKFFEDLNLPESKYKLDTVKRYQTHGGQTAEMIKGIERALFIEKPKIVLVCGDANTNLAGAIAARKLQIKVGHVEAGLRSDDWQMPEEHNRVMIDHISELLFAPTEKEKKNLIKDNVKGKIFVVGNTVVDAIYQNLEIAKAMDSILNKLGLNSDGYFLLTLHREENVDYEENLKKVLNSLEMIIEEYDKQIIFPIHPRTRKRLKEFGLKEKAESIEKLKLIPPLGYLDFLMLLANAQLVLTDSGGIQEESCVLRVPCITLRKSTERPETVKAGANFVAGLEAKDILRGLSEMLERERNWGNPFGDGVAGEKIVKISMGEISK